MDLVLIHWRGEMGTVLPWGLRVQRSVSRSLLQLDWENRVRDSVGPAGSGQNDFWRVELSKRSTDAIHTRVAGPQHTSPPYSTLTVESLEDSEVRKPRLKWFSQSHQAAHLDTLLTEGRPSSFLDAGKLTCQKIQTLFKPSFQGYLRLFLPGLSQVSHEVLV